MNARPARVVLDLDGVILRSNDIKYRAMLALFDDYPERSGAISAYILARGGVARQVKLSGIIEHVLHRKTTPQLVAHYLERYASTLERQLYEAPLIEGVASFIRSSIHDLYVCSSAPEVEVERQLGRRALLTHFQAMYGLRTPKPEALQAIADREPRLPVVFFGDSVGDWDAARTARVGFVGVVGERDNFGAVQLHKLRTFASPAEVATCIQAATNAA